MSGGLEEHAVSKKSGSLYLLLDKIRRFGFGKDTAFTSRSNDGGFNQEGTHPISFTLLQEFHNGILDL